MALDKLSPSARSALMSRVRNRDTTPELKVRRIAHAMGLRFRLHRKDLPGTPDLVFPKHHLAIMVHGCFWHQHPGCRKATIPKTRSAFWREKLHRNVERDVRSIAELKKLGWTVLVLWECQVGDDEVLRARIVECIEPSGLERTGRSRTDDQTQRD